MSISTIIVGLVVILAVAYIVHHVRGLFKGTAGCCGGGGGCSGCSSCGSSSTMKMKETPKTAMHETRK